MVLKNEHTGWSKAVESDTCSALSDGSFRIGDDDSSKDILNLSTKVHGRKQEMDVLLSTIERVRGGVPPEVVLLHGQSGVGKSFLVNALRETVTEQLGGIFVSGKFDQFPTEEPFAPIVSALSDLCDVVQQDGYESDEIASKVIKQLGPEDVSLLCDTITGLPALLGSKRSHVEHIESSTAFNRLKSSCRKFLSVVAVHHQVVMFFDDIQFADEGSLKLISFLTLPSSMQNVTFILSFRDCERSEQLRKGFETRFAVIDIHVQNLSIDAINEMLVDIVRKDAQSTLPLSEVVLTKTSGNPYYIIQFLELLQEQNFLFQDDPSNPNSSISWDLSTIQSATNATENVLANVLVKRFNGLTQKARNILQLAACLGYSFDTSVLYEITAQLLGKLSRAEFDALLNQGLKQRFLENGGKEGFLKFTHDKIQESLYEIIPSDEIGVMQYRIGRVMFNLYKKNTGDEQLLFGASSHLNWDISLLKSWSERLEVAELNFEVARAAKRQAAFPVAVDALSSGLILLGPTRWQDCYELTLSSSTLLAEMEMFTGRIDCCRKIVEEIQANAKVLEDKIQAECIMIEATNTRGDNDDETVALTMKTLRHLGEKFPKRTNILTLLFLKSKVQRMCRSMTDDQILSIPPLTDVKKLSALRALLAMTSIIPDTTKGIEVNVAMLKIMQMSLQHGLAAPSPRAFAAYATLQGIMGNRKESYRFGQLALRLMDQYEDKNIRAQTVVAVYAGCNHLRESVTKSIEPYTSAFHIGMAGGELKFGILAAQMLLNAMMVYSVDADLFVVNQHMQEAVEMLTDLYRESSLMHLISPIWQLTQNLIGESNDPGVLSGSAMNLDSFIETMNATKFFPGNAVLWQTQLQLAITFGKFSDLIELVPKLDQIDFLIRWQANVYNNKLYFGLACFEMYRKTKKRVNLKRGRRTLKMIAQWEADGNINCRHLKALFDAEAARCTKKRVFQSVKAKYDEALSFASNSGLISAAAIICEKAAEFCSECHEYPAGLEYWENSIANFQQWGAQAKVAQMEWLKIRRFPEVGQEAQAVNDIPLTELCF